ncbi:hypothetical protein [uncultured Amaricoccus sp.]|uniref:hypothetical protein n=1 Tax=uncultured Amaricoccus sp. TaxID=339341 RepID=UPI0026035E37|nr:hypothetical protein [uncultured Amaricoccus sp.]
MDPAAHWERLRARVIGAPQGQSPEWLATWRANSIAVLTRNAENGKRLIWC